MKKSRKIYWSITTTVIYALLQIVVWNITKINPVIFFWISLILFGLWFMIMAIFWSYIKTNYAKAGEDYPKR